MLQVGAEGERGRSNDSVSAQTIEIRAADEPRPVIDQVRTTLAKIDPNLAVILVATLSDDEDRAIGGDHAVAVLATGSAILVLILAGVGLHGLTTYGVRRRTSEIVVRLALGSTRGAVVTLIVREVLAQGVAGVLIGIPAAVILLRLLGTTLFGVGPVDGVDTAMGIAALLACVVAAACLPAIRASHQNPVIALRSD